MMRPQSYFFKTRPFQRPGSSIFSKGIRRCAHELLLIFSYLDFCVAKFFYPANDQHESQRRFQGKKILIYSVFINNEKDFLRLKNEILDLQTDFDLVLLVNTGEISILGITKNVEKFAVFDRKNTQRDFGSYKFALKKINFDGCRQICLINDSVFWQRNAVSEFLKKAESNKARVIGMSKSTQRGIHLQSYCILFKDPKIDDFRAILELPPVLLKRSIVHFGELRLSRELRKHHSSFDGIWDAEGLLESFQPLTEIERNYRDYLDKYIGVRIPLNPSIHLAIPLYRKAGIIKKVALRENPAKFSTSITSILNGHLQEILVDMPVEDLEKD